MDADAKKQCDDEKSRDRLSDLPDCVIHKILSSFDTKFVVQTSLLLSTRWKNIWMTIPTLKFSFRKADYCNVNHLSLRTAPSNLNACYYTHSYYPSYYYPGPSYSSTVPSYLSPPYSPTCPAYTPTLRDKNRYTAEKALEKAKTSFLLFVKEVLNRRAGSKIDRLYLSCDVVLSEINIDFILSNVIEAYEVDVSINEANVVLPQCFYHSKSLTKLRLDIHGLCLTINQGFLALRELKINGLRTSRSLGFFSRCLVLESLSFSDCKLENSALIISAPMLKNLEIMKSCFDVVVISSPLIEMFRFEDSEPIDMCIDDKCCSLERVDLDVKRPSTSSSLTKDVEKLIAMIGELKYAKYVAVSLRVLKMLSEVDYESKLPLFPNLKSLKLKTEWSISKKGLNWFLKNSASNEVETSIQVPYFLRSGLKDSKII